MKIHVIKGAIGSAQVAAIVVALASCSSGTDVKKDLGSRDYPSSNSGHSKGFVLAGEVDPGLKIMMAARWVAQNPDCRVKINWLEGVFAPFYADIPITLTWSANQYSTVVYRDAMEPGRCGWAFKEVVVAGEDEQGRKIKMMEVPEPQTPPKVDSDLWGWIVVMTGDPLPKKDSSGVRNLMCAPSTTLPDSSNSSLLRCVEIVKGRGGFFASTLWINPQSERATVNFHH